MRRQNLSWHDAVEPGEGPETGRQGVSLWRCRRYSGVVLLGVVLLLSGCAGNGDGLDEQGNPISSDTTAPDEPPPTDNVLTFTSMQETIFVPFCVCHVGAAAPLGLVLNSAATFALLVNTSSNEVPDLLRVAPGHPDDSYLVRKLEGGPDIVGFQMPPTELGEQHLPQETIDLVRGWIAAGAPNN